MLTIPEEGMVYSVNEHNVDFNIFCDWIEASVVFSEDPVTQSDVRDILLEEEVYVDQEFAQEIIERAWAEISMRTRYLSGPLGISVAGDRISKVQDWTDFPEYAFCLLLACAELYPSWTKTWTGSASLRGDLFEELSKEAMIRLLPGWTVKRIGWSPTNPVRLIDVIYNVITELHEIQATELATHVNKDSKELGLDIYAYKEFGDIHASMPLIFAQCATGKNWKNKRHTPPLTTWSSIISFTSKPVRALAIPFTIPDRTEFRKWSREIDGIFFDRNRLVGSFSAGTPPIPAALKQQLSDWVSANLATAPVGE